MKHIKNFKFFEKIIIPEKLSSNIRIDSFMDLVKYGDKNGFDVVRYEEFYNSLDEVDKKTAPPKHGMPFFALYNKIRNKPMFVVNDDNIIRRIPNFIEVVNDIISHEKIHSQQNDKREIQFALPNPMIKKEYFSNKDEIMAFSWSIANDLSKKSKNVKDAFYDLDNKENTYYDRIPWVELWKDIKNNCDEDIIKRYKKYIYLYLEEIYSKDVEKVNIHNRINNK